MTAMSSAAMVERVLQPVRQYVRVPRRCGLSRRPVLLDCTRLHRRRLRERNHRTHGSVRRRERSRRRWREASCVTPACGDGFVDPGEACDDGNTSSTDTCSNACQIQPPSEDEGCSATGRSSLWLLVVALGFVVRRRRRA